MSRIIGRSGATGLILLATVSFGLAAASSASADDYSSQLGPCSSLEKVAVAPDGSTVALGTTGDCKGADRLLLVKLTPGGELDQSFGDRGIEFLPAALGAEIVDLKLQGDGKPVVVTPDSIFRLTSAGLPDAGFGESGRVDAQLTNVGGTQVGIGGATIDPLGRILVAGTASQPAVERFLGDGTVDSSFGDSGTARPDLSGVPVSNAMYDVYGLGVAGDGSIIVGGWFHDSPQNSLGAIRLSDEGVFDTTYGHVGVGNADGLFGETHEPFFGTVAVSPSGSVRIGVALGVGVKAFPSYYTMDLDGQGAYQGGTLPFSGPFYRGPYRPGGYPEVGDLDVSGPRTYATSEGAPQPADDDVGAFYATTKSNFAVAGYDDVGDDDPNFGDRGVTITKIGPGYSHTTALKTRGNTLTAVGVADGIGCSPVAAKGPGPCQVMVLGRYDRTNGKLDPSFGQDGVVTLPAIDCPGMAENDGPGGSSLRNRCDPEPVKLNLRGHLTHPRSRKAGLAISTYLYQGKLHYDPVRLTATVSLPAALTYRFHRPKREVAAFQKVTIKDEPDLTWDTLAGSSSKKIRFASHEISDPPRHRLRIVFPAGSIKPVAKRFLGRKIKVRLKLGYLTESAGWQTSTGNLRIKFQISK